MEINGARIEALMKRKGWSQGRLAKEASVAQPTIWAMIHGVYRNPSKVPQVAAALDVPVEVLFEPGPLPETLPRRKVGIASAPGGPLTVGVFIDEGMTALEIAFREEDLPYDARDAARTVADWWISLTEELGLGEIQKVSEAKTAEALRAALQREVAREVRSTKRATRMRDITTPE